MSCTMNKRRSTKEKLNLMKAFFGRRCKFNRGNSNPEHKVWIFGIVERSTNRLIIYPVDRRICKFCCFCPAMHITNSQGICLICSLSLPAFKLHWRNFSWITIYLFSSTFCYILLHAEHVAWGYCTRWLHGWFQPKNGAVESGLRQCTTDQLQ